MEQIDILRKRLLYQSQHRGMKEMDLVLGGFAKHSLHTMARKELVQFEELLAFSDQDLYGWFFERTTVPKNAPRELIKILDNFIKNK